jgi:hypothetical protein
VQPGSFARIISTVVAVILIGTVAWLKTQPQSTKGTFPLASDASQTPGRYDLGHDEQLGGHTLQRHVARSDEQLVERLAREPDISAASTYTDRVAAEKTVGDALAQEKSRVESWLNRSDAHPNLALQFHGHNPIGRSIRRGEDASQACYDAAVILRWDGDHRFHVLTTYPEPARAR